jgi:hypothetical protein
MTELQASRGTAPHADQSQADGTPDSPTIRRASLEAVAVAGVVASGWALMAMTHPTTTYHFAPIIAVAVVALYVRGRVDRPLGFRRGLSLAGAGVLIAVIATTVLGSLNALRGPTLWGTGSALAETLMAIAVGFLIGATAMIGPRRRETHS